MDESDFKEGSGVSSNDNMYIGVIVVLVKIVVVLICLVFRIRRNNAYWLCMSCDNMA